MITAKLSAIQKQEIVTKIRQSNTFKKASTSNALLQYLNNATLKGTNLKEGVIDLDFFGSKEASDKNNPRVRVNVYNLRKKITQYYETEGKDDLWQLTIDKGQYEVRFFKKQVRKPFINKLSWRKSLPYLGLLITISALIYTNTTPKPPSLWKSIITKEKPTHLIIGDHFGVTGNTITGGFGWTRDFEINNINEFYALLEEKPELKNTIRPANYTYTTRMAALAAQQFERLYQHYNQDLDIRFSTLTSISVIKEGNAIYAGPIKNKNQFIHFFNEANPYFTIANGELHLSNHPQLKDTIFNLKPPIVEEEYAIVSKYPSIGDSEHFVFFSDHDIGVSATAEYFTNKDSIQNFVNTYLKDKKYFTAIFKVKGQHRTNTDIKLEMAVGF
ncbi:helix-turn-helix domain-containing protein [Lutibacter citreus]|uniref:helix-turn-helix domain-containing protein n=1 Tax=Lutibacter citreus TaxID=2138210 RepID=UPI000DBE0BD8|nr:helix-turn-helix domain-containing protein [Lutibacter citreus]